MTCQPMLITQNVIRNTLNYLNSPLLSYTIYYPQFESFGGEYQARHLSTYYANKAIEFRSYAQNILYPEAMDSQQRRLKEKEPLIPYEMMITYNTTYNENNLLSIYQDAYINRGKAHGELKRHSNTWKVPTAQLLSIEDFFPRDDHFKDHLEKEILRQAAQSSQNGTGVYYPDCAVLIHKYFDNDNFYLLAAPNRLCIFYQEYEIAPYVMGIPTFEIFAADLF